jgi:hypothetical protein
LAGRQEPTQVGQALRALGIQSIFALSPQAKGRIEGLFGTLQDRLGAELDLARGKTPQGGNDTRFNPFSNQQLVADSINHSGDLNIPVSSKFDHLFLQMGIIPCRGEHQMVRRKTDPLRELKIFPSHGGYPRPWGPENYGP